MEAELRDQGYTDIQLIAGSGGIFEVKKDGRLLYSKAQTGRFPETEEILSLLQHS